MTQRPAFDPVPCFDAAHHDPAPLQDFSQVAWLPIVSCAAGFPANLFESALEQLITNPEYNSSLILRADILEDLEYDCGHEPSEPPSALSRMSCTRRMRRLVLARRPNRDASLLQDCSYYAPETDPTSPSCLVLTPLLEPDAQLPYYHPPVARLAIRYITSPSPSLRIEVVRLPDDLQELDLNSRLYRVCVSLLDSVHRYGWGKMTNYQKRVQHDRIVNREAYQDLYLVLRERHQHLVSEWKESTDPLKHVYEELGIATFLMLLWKDMYPQQPASFDDPSRRPWYGWPRPPGGFLDLGCGAGLLTHILIQEGYLGQGIDVHSRKSWTHYPETTRGHLSVRTLDPTNVSAESDPLFQGGVFLIGNHADELTPWLPVIATLVPECAGYLSIPCCGWAFDSRFERSKVPSLPDTLALSPIDASCLHLQGDTGQHAMNSSYAIYRTWLGKLSYSCGWQIECEVLRIPSTRNWSIIGRKRIATSSEQENAIKQAVRDLVADIKTRGLFQARSSEREGH